MSSASSRAHVIALLLLVAAVGAQEPPKDQPPLWSAKPDVVAFEKMENARLTTAQHAIDQVAAVEGSRTIETTLTQYDEAIRQLNAAINFSTLMQQVHPDAAFRDHATAMTTKVSSAQTALSTAYHKTISIVTKPAPMARSASPPTILISCQRWILLRVTGSAAVSGKPFRAELTPRTAMC